jgi:hypothetical protein
MVKSIKVTLFLLFCMIPAIAGKSDVQRMAKDYCQVFGVIYIEKNKNMADYLVYLEKDEAFADMWVFKEDNRMFADKEGIWFITSNRGFADYTIYLEKSRGAAHFSINYTDVVSFAGCR